MDTNSGLRKSAGSWLAVIAVLAFGLAQLAIPQRAAAQEHANAQPHQALVGLPNVNPKPPGRPTNAFNWSGRQSFFNQGGCGVGPSASFFDDSNDSIFGSAFDNQPSTVGTSPGMQSWLGGPEAAFWYGYNSSQLSGWSYGHSNLNPVLGFCGGFQGLTP